MHLVSLSILILIYFCICPAFRFGPAMIETSPERAAHLVDAVAGCLRDPEARVGATVPLLKYVWLSLVGSPLFGPHLCVVMNMWASNK